MFSFKSSYRHRADEVTHAVADSGIDSVFGYVTFCPEVVVLSLGKRTSMIRRTHEATHFPPDDKAALL